MLMYSTPNPLYSGLLLKTKIFFLKTKILRIIVAMKISSPTDTSATQKPHPQGIVIILSV